MDAGKLDRKISIYAISYTKDDWNHDQKMYSNLGEFWAKRVDLRPSEEIEANQKVAITRTEWWIRYQEGLSRGMNVRHDGEVFEIIGIQIKGRKEWLILTTEMREDGI